MGLPIMLMCIVWLLTRNVSSRAVRGTMLISMVGLVVMGYPLGQILYGDAGVARVAMYDIGNVLFISTAALWIAQAYGTRGRQNLSGSLLAILKTPLIWAVIAGVALSLLRIPITGVVADVTDRLAAANTPLMMISVGTYLIPRMSQLRQVLLVAFIRMVLGGLLGWALVRLVGLGNMETVLITTLASLPVGATPLIYSSSEGLDAELAAACISFTVVVSVVVISFLPYLLRTWYPVG